MYALNAFFEVLGDEVAESLELGVLDLGHAETRAEKQVLEPVLQHVLQVDHRVLHVHVALPITHKSILR